MFLIPVNHGDVERLYFLASSVMAHPHKKRHAKHNTHFSSIGLVIFGFLCHLKCKMLLKCFSLCSLSPVFTRKSTDISQSDQFLAKITQ